MYPNGSSSIGNLLRLIQEDQNQAIGATLPSAQPGSPIRGVVQQPLQSPESPNSNRVISTRPEGVIASGPQASPEVVAPIAPNPAVVGPITEAPRIPTGTLLNNAPRPSSQGLNLSPNISTPNIGTRITPTKTAVPSARFNTPLPSRVGSPIAKAPEKAREFVGLNPGQDTKDKVISNIFKAAPGNIFQNLFPKLFAPAPKPRTPGRSIA